MQIYDILFITAKASEMYQTVDALRQTLASMSSTCPFDPSICGIQDTIVYDLDFDFEKK
jgi:hypothetical protein